MSTSLAIKELRQPFHAALGVAFVVPALTLASSILWLQRLASPALQVGLVVALGAFAAVLLAVLIESIRRAMARENSVHALEQSLARAQSRARDGSQHKALAALAKALWSSEVPLDARVAKVQAEVLSVIWRRMAKTVAVATLEAACDCGAPTRVPAQHGGRAVRCPACGARVRVLVAPLDVRESLDLLFAKFGTSAHPSTATVEPSRELAKATESVREWLFEASQHSKKSGTTGAHKAISGAQKAVSRVTPALPSAAIAAPADTAAAPAPKKKSSRKTRAASSKATKAISTESSPVAAKVVTKDERPSKDERTPSLPAIEIPMLDLADLDEPMLELGGPIDLESAAPVAASPLAGSDFELEVPPELDVPESAEAPALQVEEFEPELSSSF